MKDMNISGYKITTEPKSEIYPAELEKQFPDLIRNSQDRKNKHIIPKLEKLIQKYPEVPDLKDFLVTAFLVKGMPKRADALTTRIVQDHPDYLFARINEAERLLAEGQEAKVPEVLGQEMDLKALYPDREEFHIIEVLSFMRTAAYYFILTQNVEEAENRLAIIKELAPDDDRTKKLEEALTSLRLLKGFERIQEFKKGEIVPERPQKALPEQGVNQPGLNHPEVEALYQYDLRIPEAKLQEILALPRPTLIEDLQAVLRDGLSRYEYFLNDEALEDVDFVLHALFLLGELKATEALPQITDFLEYDDDFLEFWLGDHLHENLWRVFYQLSRHNPELLQPVLLNPQVAIYARTQAAFALAQLALHEPGNREKVVTIFKHIFQEILNAPEGGDLINTEFVGLATWSASDARLHELLPALQHLHEKKYLLGHFIGDYPKIEEIFRSEPEEDHKKELLPLPQFYQKILQSWHSYQEEAPAAKAPNFLKPAAKRTESLGMALKAGRNDPCPCGSGKKYKKCCGG